MSWPATGVGSLPGTDPLEAARTVLGELPELPHLVELPARGPHADLTGRATALLVDLPADLQPSGWRLVARPSRDGRRAQDLLARDLDALDEAAGGTPPPALKVQVAGPWTLAATLETTRGERVLADHAAVADLAASLAEGVRLHLADLRGRHPGTELVLQLDEPGLTSVLAGAVPTASGFGRLRVPTEQVVQERLGTVLDAAATAGARTVVHCCAPQPPLALLRRAGAQALAVDATLLTRREHDALGEAVEAGVGLLLGALPSSGTTPDPGAAEQVARTLWQRLGLAPELLATAVGITPACGLAGASPGYARAAMSACVEAGRRLREAPE